MKHEGSKERRKKERNGERKIIGRKRKGKERQKQNK